MLREPSERAISHWKMRVRLGRESRPLQTVIAEQLADPDRWRRTLVEEDGYVAYGEYGRILAEYREHFDASQLLVIRASSLKADPVGVVGRVCTFLGLDAHEPAALGTDFNVSERAGKRGGLERRIWDALPYEPIARRFSQKSLNRVGMFLDRHGISRPAATQDDSLGEELRAELRRHYVADLDAMPVEYRELGQLEMK